MILKEKTGIQQWVDSFQRQRVYTVLNRIKKLLDFAAAFYPVKIEIRLQSLELLPIKNLARTSQSLVFNISPRINISISNVLQYQETGEYKIQIEPYFRLSYFNRTMQRKTPTGGRRIMGEHKVHPYVPPGILCRGKSCAHPNSTSHHFFAFLNELPENVYIYKKVAGALTRGDRYWWRLPAARGVWTSPGSRIYTYQNEVHLEYKRNYLSAAVIKTIFSGPGQNSDRLVRGSLNTNKAPIISTTAHTQVESFVYKKTTHLNSINKKLLGMCHGVRGSHGMGNLLIRNLKLQNTNYNVQNDKQKTSSPLLRARSQELRASLKPPHASQGRRQQTNLNSTLELVTKKIKKIEIEIDVEKIEKTMVQNLSHHLDQTINQRLEKRLAPDSRDTLQLTENIYSRLLNRIVLEKERSVY